MKKSINMNLSGQIFHIDEDAYRLLEEYLKNLQRYFSRSGGDPDIMQDFEERIAEHLIELSPSGSRVVNLALITHVIELMGQPEEIFDLEQQAPSESSKQPPSRESPANAASALTHEPTSTKRKLYRNLEGAWLCGVFNGLATYMNWSVGALRIVFVLASLFLLENWIMIPLLLYLGAWMIIPAAQTATQKLEMYGHPVSAITIGERIRYDATQITEDHSGKRVTGCCLGGCLGSIGLLVLLVGFFAVIVRIITELEAGGVYIEDVHPLDWSYTWVGYSFPLLVLSAILLVIIPLLSWVHSSTWGSKQRGKEIPSWVRIIGIVIWIVAAVYVSYYFVDAFIYNQEHGWKLFQINQHGIRIYHP
ncbi:PspC domain-containing protein [Porphyromonas sp. COT-239 OH1446]|uniref:PspC domain-containing protein n=1 Tax=Porphyromonas sp. COT-239 OH1446 TaxID=1515613 RepID=UPI00068B09EC|nr:PspC domain-containing protein [Porphyromonas sp. COT-239 OH1446]